MQKSAGKEQPSAKMGRSGRMVGRSERAGRGKPTVGWGSQIGEVVGGASDDAAGRSRLADLQKREEAPSPELKGGRQRSSEMTIEMQGKSRKKRP